MNGRPCRCTPVRRAWYTRGCADTCPFHGLQHAKCPKGEPVSGRPAAGSPPPTRPSPATASTAPPIREGGRGTIRPRRSRASRSFSFIHARPRVPPQTPSIARTTSRSAAPSQAGRSHSDFGDRAKPTHKRDAHDRGPTSPPDIRRRPGPPTSSGGQRPWRRSGRAAYARGPGGEGATPPRDGTDGRWGRPGWPQAFWTCSGACRRAARRCRRPHQTTSQTADARRASWRWRQVFTQRPPAHQALRLDLAAQLRHQFLQRARLGIEPEQPDDWRASSGWAGSGVIMPAFDR